MGTQPIIRGIEAVGSVTIKYRYNGNGGVLTGNTKVINAGGTDLSIDTSGGVNVAGFRLDSNFLRAAPQIASSFMIPLLGGGAIALTNNNRSGTLNIACTRVSQPVAANAATTASGVTISNAGDEGSMVRATGSAIGPDTDKVYDLVLLAQMQQSQEGGDSAGATIQVSFQFSDLYTVVSFEGCTIASVDPIGLSGNDAVDYNVQINYLNWTMNTGSTTENNALTSITGA